MCDCDCRCWHSKPVRQRLTNTFIHTDIFGAGDGQLNVKCVEHPGLQHEGCRCNRLWQEPVVKDIRHRPRDHPNNHFYNQELGNVGCCHVRHCHNQEIQKNQQEHQQQQPNDIAHSQSQTLPVRNVVSHYYCPKEQPPAGRYDHPKGNGCSATGYYPKSRGIHTGEAIMYDRHEYNKDQWFNDAKEREIDRLNCHLNRGYSSYRKQIDMASNAFDFVDDTLALPCRPTAKFPTSNFQNDCCVSDPVPRIESKECCKQQLQHAVEQEPSPPQPSSAAQQHSKSPDPTVSFKPVEEPKIPPKTVKPASSKAAITRPAQQKTTFKPSTASGPRTVVHAKEDLENKSSVMQATKKCGCNCKCWQVAGRK